jgi:gamma-glutamylcyclotransferase (GGCT)/AIG2-like uncharacterized protein YtfP
VSGTSQQRPVFVYGTLLPGQPNWERLLGGRTERVLAGSLPGVVLLDCGDYPAAVERSGAGGAAGEAVWIRPGAWAAVLAALDHLEGYDPADPDRLFDRVVRPVETAGGPVDCWVYLAGRTLVASARPVVAEGDWIAYVRCGSSRPARLGRPPGR